MVGSSVVDAEGAAAVHDAAEPAPASSAARAEVAAPCLFCADYGRLLADDTKHVFTAPVHWHDGTWKAAGRDAAIVLGAMALLDKPVHEYVDGHHTSAKSRIADTFEPFGARDAAGVLAAYWIAGRLSRRPNVEATAVDGVASAMIAAGLIVPALKEVTGRSRPRADQGPHDFHAFSGAASFPSGHTAAAFAIASTIARHNDALWVKGLAYGAASLVGYARMEHDAHFLSDVTAGAMIGVGVAGLVYRRDVERRHRLAMASVQGPGASGPGVSVVFRTR